MVDPRRFAAIKQTRLDIASAEVELAALRQSINDFEALVDRRLGELLDRLSELEGEVESLTAQVRQIRDRRLYGEHQMRYAEGAPRPEQSSQRAYVPNQDVPGESPAPAPVPHVPHLDAKAELKRLYRRLARMYHPDLAVDGADRAQRTRHMALINQAFAAGNLAALSRMVSGEGSEPPAFDFLQPAAPVEEQDELERLQERLHALRQQITRLNTHPNVQLSMEVKLARQRSKDLLGEMAKELRHKIARKTAERDYLQSQLAANT